MNLIIAGILSMAFIGLNRPVQFDLNGTTILLSCLLI